MLWINLIQDTLASLALSTEPPSEHLLNRKPYGRKATIISGAMLRNIVGQGCYQLLVMFLLIFARGKRWFPEEKNTVPCLNFAEQFFGFLRPDRSPTEDEANTLIFNIFVMMTIVNLINSRCIHSERNVFARIFRNRVFFIIIVIMIGTQVNTKLSKKECWY